MALWQDFPRCVRPVSSSGVYVTTSDKNPKGPEKGTQRSFRGDGWIGSTPSVQTAQRNGTDHNTKTSWTKFRCAQDVKNAGESDQAKLQQTSLWGRWSIRYRVG